MKVLLFTHEQDIDGMGSVLIGKKAFSELDYVPCKTFEIDKNLNEYLLNRCTLSKVLGVKIEGNTAVITTVLIPKHIWDKKQHIETPKKSY